jgi:hypothetical protein
VRAAVLAAVLTASACGSARPAAPEGVFLPRLAQHHDTWPAALVSGRLVEENGCVFITPDHPGSDHASVLLIWPNEASAERMDDGRLRISVGDDAAVSVGDVVSLDGGLVGEARSDVGHAESMIGEAIPERCRAEDGYWITPGPA